MLTFRVDDQSFALAAGLVREIARMPRLSRVPHAPPHLLGLANLRGSVVPVLSMALLLQRAETAPTRIIVVDAGELFGLAVDDASQVLETGQIGSALAVDVADLIARNLPAQSQRRSRGASAAPLRADDDRSEAIALVAFAIGDQEFALPLAAVEEVLMLPGHVAVMPDADAVVVGSAAVRGAVLPLLSLAALLALPRLAASSRTRVLVARIGKQRIGLLVDEMRSILRVPEAMIDPVPQALARGGSEARIQAICRLDDGKRLVSVLAADQLLRDDITARLGQSGSAERDDMVQDDRQAATEQFLIFRIGSEEFGIPIGSVEEVAALPAKLTRLPKAPAFVQGVMNLRGQVIPVIDQGQRFGAAASAASRRRVIVVRIGDLHAGFIVDAVSEVVRVAADDLQPAPDLGNDETRVFERVANLADQDRIVLIVSPRELLDRAEQDLLRSLGRKGAKTPS